MNHSYNTQSTSSLLRRTQLLPGESLVSLLERLTQLNHYLSSRTLSRICYDRSGTLASLKTVTYPRELETFLRLADLTHISPDELYDASNHCFASFMTSPQENLATMPWLGSTSKTILANHSVWGHLRSASTAQFCPHCLKSAAYHHSIWIPVSTAICLEHHCFLVNRCPGCKKRISIREIVKKRCQNCQADLSMAKTRSVKSDTLGVLSQEIIQSWLAGTNVIDISDKYRLPSQQPVVLYRFLENLSRRLLKCWKDWPSLPKPLNGLANHIAVPARQLQMLIPKEIFYLQKAAFTGLTNWPHGLFKYLDAYSGYNTFAQDPGKYIDRLQRVRYDWFQARWRIPEFEFMHQGLVDYLVSRHIPLPTYVAEQFMKETWFIERTGLWSEQMTAQTLGVSVDELDRYIALDYCLWPCSRARCLLFERDKVLALKQRWTLGWSVPDASSWLGIHDWDVIELVKRKILTLVNKPSTEPSHWVLSRQSVENFFASTTSQLKLFDGARRDIMSLYEVAGMTSCLGIDCLSLLQNVADGSLPAFKMENKITTLRCICFSEAMVWDLLKAGYAERDWVEGFTFTLEKGICPDLLVEWMASGLIKTEAIFGRYRYFSRRSLEQLAAMSSPPRAISLSLK